MGAKKITHKEISQRNIGNGFRGEMQLVFVWPDSAISDPTIYGTRSVQGLRRR